MEMTEKNIKKGQKPVLVPYVCIVTPWKIYEF